MFLSHTSMQPSEMEDLVSHHYGGLLPDFACLAWRLLALFIAAGNPLAGTLRIFFFTDLQDEGLDEVASDAP